MEIHIKQSSGTTSVGFFDPRSNSYFDTRALEDGHELAITAVTAHETSDLEIGEVKLIEPGDDEQ